MDRGKDERFAFLTQVNRYIDALLANGKKEDVLEVEGLAWRGGRALGYNEKYFVYKAKGFEDKYVAFALNDEDFSYHALFDTIQEAKQACQDNHNKRVLDQIKLIGA